MAVVTAAATTMANSAEAARPRRSTAARTSMRKNIEVCGACARLAATSRAGVRHGRAHSSPRKRKHGIQTTARRIAAALPAKVTITAMARITGNSTGGIEISELKIECPI